MAAWHRGVGQALWQKEDAEDIDVAEDPDLVVLAGRVLKAIDISGP
jgi:hypothetical protein